MVLFGGWNGDQFFNDVHVLDLQIMAWSKPDCSGKIFLFHRKSLGPAPCPRKGHCAILIGTNLVIHGGFQYTDEAMKAAGFKN